MSTRESIYEKPVVVQCTSAVAGVFNLNDIQTNPQAFKYDLRVMSVTLRPLKAARTLNIGNVWIMVRSGIRSFGVPLVGDAGWLLQPSDYPFNSIIWECKESYQYHLSDFWIDIETDGDGVEVGINV